LALTKQSVLVGRIKAGINVMSTTTSLREDLETLGILKALVSMVTTLTIVAPRSVIVYADNPLEVLDLEGRESDPPVAKGGADGPGHSK
jgi:hypothetical protein